MSSDFYLVNLWIIFLLSISYIKPINWLLFFIIIKILFLSITWKFSILSSLFKNNEIFSGYFLILEDLDEIFIYIPYKRVDRAKIIKIPSEATINLIIFSDMQKFETHTITINKTQNKKRYLGYEKGKVIESVIESFIEEIPDIPEEKSISYFI